MKRVLFRTGLVAFPLLISGCLMLPGNTTSPIPTLTPIPTLACDADDTLRQVEQLLAGRTFEAHYLTLGHELTLSIWLVDPGLDQQSSESSLAESSQQVLQSGLLLSYQVIQ